MMSPRAVWWVSGGLCLLLCSGCASVPRRLTSEAGVSRFTQSAPRSAPPAPERYIVQLQPHIHFAELAQHITGFPVQPDIEYTTVFDGFAAPLTQQQVQALRQSRGVLRVIPDQQMELKWELPQPMTFRIIPTEQQNPTGIDRIDAELQHINCSAVGIAIVDTGLWKKHQDLNIVGGYNCIVGQDAAEWNDTDGHGTRVAEVAAANAENNLGVRGVA
ncbi:MAG: S8 family serine peptidase, partial [Abditibacteriales bacterium]|nr:S8 family serine peptidase [Abditibacteriales bacterium]